MIRAFVNLGKWLEQRFPEKVVITLESYNSLVQSNSSLQAEMSMLRQQVADLALSVDKANERLSVVESSAVHKGAVADMLAVLAQLKDDYTSFKASMGFTYKRQGSNEIQALLNGEYLPTEGNNNG